MDITTPIKIEFTEDFNIKLEEMAVGGTPAKALTKSITLGTGLFGRTIVEMTYKDNVMAFLDDTSDINSSEGLVIDFATSKKRKS